MGRSGWALAIVVVALFALLGCRPGDPPDTGGAAGLTTAPTPTTTDAERPTQTRPSRTTAQHLPPPPIPTTTSVDPLHGCSLQQACEPLPTSKATRDTDDVPSPTVTPVTESDGAGS